MLKIAIDDPAAKRLVLRAERWGAIEILRRMLATGLSAGALFGAVWIAFSDGWTHLFWTLPVALGVAWWLLNAPPKQTAEIGADGSSGVLWVRRRGQWCWLSSRVEIATGDHRRLVRLRGGLVGPRGFLRPELGLELWEGEYDDKPLRPLAPRFAVEGIDRRDEVRQLADALAQRLGLRVTIEHDTLSELRIAVSQRGEEPPIATRIGGAYREAASSVGLELARAPSFEEPRTRPVALPPSGSPELREQLRYADGVLTVESPEPRGVGKPRIPLWIVWPTIGCAVLGGIIGAFSGEPLLGVLAGAAIVPIFALSVTVSVVSAILATFAIIGAFLFVDRLVRGFVRTRPGGLFTAKPRRWTLRDGTLEVKALFGTRRYAKGEVQAVVLAPMLEGGGKRPYSAWRELWLRTSWRWIRLARSTSVRSHAPGATPVLESLAVEVARALDAPLRSASD